MSREGDCKSGENWKKRKVYSRRHNQHINGHSACLKKSSTLPSLNVCKDGLSILWTGLFRAAGQSKRARGDLKKDEEESGR